MAESKRATVLRGLDAPARLRFVKGQGDALVLSPDDLFAGRPWNPVQAGEATGQSLRQYVEALQRRERHVVVNAENRNVHDFSPFAALAVAYGYQLEIVSIYDPGELAEYLGAKGGKAPPARAEVVRFYDGSAAMPPYWPHREVAADEAK